MIFSILSCNNNSTIGTSKNNEILKKVIGSKLIIPNGMKSYNTLHRTDSIVVPRYNIYKIIDVSCGSCLSLLTEWEKYMLIFKKKNVQLNFICISDDDFQLFEYIYDNNGFPNYPFPLFFDKEMKFIEMNSFILGSPHYSTILTDKCNSIMLIGDPTKNKKISKLYQRFINK